MKYNYYFNFYNMDLIVEPDSYVPSINDNGDYIDMVPSFNNLKNGLRCLCGSRKDKCYESYSIFSSHIKTKSHQKWLINLNNNKANYYSENEKLKNIINNQKLLIAKFEKKLNNRNNTIDYLTSELIKKNECVMVTNLIDF